jgi:hypothetical protein
MLIDKYCVEDEDTFTLNLGTWLSLRRMWHRRCRLRKKY